MRLNVVYVVVIIIPVHLLLILCRGQCSRRMNIIRRIHAGLRDLFQLLNKLVLELPC